MGTPTCGKPTLDGSPCQNAAGCTANHHGPNPTAVNATSAQDVKAAAADVSDETVESMSELKQAMAGLVDSDRLAKYLESRSMFRRYSPSNQALILGQNPDATVVAPYSTWKALDRHVCKGEKAMVVCVPRTRKRKEVDDATGEESESSYTYFSYTGKVFDVSQTDGEPLPTPYDDLEGDAPTAMTSRLNEVAAEAGIPVSEKELPAGMGGYWDPAKNEIVISASASDAEKATTLAHELGHAFDPTLSADPSIYPQQRADCEAVAESVSYMVSRRYGLDNSEQASGYLFAWTKGDPDRISKVMERVDAASKRILPPSELDKAVDGAAAKAKADWAANKKSKGKKSGKRKKAA